MLVSKEHKKIILNLRDPERVTAIIPRSRIVDVKGRPLVAVEHGLDEARVLRNIGIPAPSPIRYYYDWPGRFKPFSHQIDTAEFLTLNPRAFCLNDMGTGKTLSVLWAFDWLRSMGIVRRMLVTSPLSTLERTWGDEIFKNFPHLDFAVLHGDKRRREAQLERDADIFIINHDGIKGSLLTPLCEREGIDLVAIDEMAEFRNPQTDRWKALNVLVNGNPKRGVAPKPYVWGMTGTPVPKAPTDAFGQVRVVRPDATKVKYFSAFRDTVMRPLGPYKWVARDDALRTVYGIMQPSIRFAREECIDLPPTTHVNRVVELSSEQAKAYKEMLNTFRTEFKGGQITAVNAAVKANKLLQIVCGTAYGADGDIVLPAKERIDAVKEIIDEAGGKVIVFVPFTGALNAVAEALAEEFTVACVHGGVSKNERDRIFREFQDDADPRVLVANPGTMSHGLTLTAANTVVWYAPIHNAGTYEQANARVTRPGQKQNTLIVGIEGSTLERRMYDKLENRIDAQDTLLGLFKE